jgi:hypothetical protein
MDLRLPHEVLDAVLKFVPQNLRLEHCSRVSKAFLKAAIAATQEVYLNCQDHENTFSFRNWCTKHAVKIHSLELIKPIGSVVQPASKHLQQLTVMLL